MTGPGSPDSGSTLSYADAGVDIAAGNEAVARIRSLVARARRPEQIDDIGGFAGMFAVPPGLEDPVLVSCADGVGTKLMVAIGAGRHDTVGIDLVAMNVNDLVCTGAEPLFLLDYIACGKLQPTVIEQIVSGIVEGCTQASCALLGGETAEMPGMYADDHYDLAAFAVGVVARKAALGPHRVRTGDVVLGLPSSGLHSNGYSLARKALLDPAHAGLALTDRLPGSDVSVQDALLTPTRIYVRAMKRAMQAVPGAVHAAAHITGGGLIENPPRAITPEQAIELDLSPVAPPPILAAIAAQGVPVDEMRRTFNGGLGLLLLVDADSANVVADALCDAGEPCLRVGTVVARDSEQPSVRFLSDT